MGRPEIRSFYRGNSFCSEPAGYKYVRRGRDISTLSFLMDNLANWETHKIITV